METDCIKLEDLKRVALNPGDVLVVRLSIPKHVVRYGVENLMAQNVDTLKKVFTKNEVLIITDDIEMFVVSKPDAIGDIRDAIEDWEDLHYKSENPS
jgi:hypothetical protein